MLGEVHTVSLTKQLSVGRHNGIRATCINHTTAYLINKSWWSSTFEGLLYVILLTEIELVFLFYMLSQDGQSKSWAVSDYHETGQCSSPLSSYIR